MKTTIYKNDDLIGVVMDSEKTNEWNRLVKLLDIKIPTQIGDRPIPFLLLNERMQKMFSTLCPSKSVLSAYSREHIPLEVLQVAAFCKSENFFDLMEVWYDDKAPDPVLVGTKKELYVKSWYYNTNEIPDKKWHGKPLSIVDVADEIPKSAIEDRVVGLYLIARWGDEDKSFEELRDKAVKRFRYQVTNECQQQIRVYQRQIDDIDSQIASQFPIL